MRGLETISTSRHNGRGPDSMVLGTVTQCVTLLKISSLVLFVGYLSELYSKLETSSSELRLGIRRGIFTDERSCLAHGDSVIKSISGSSSEGTTYLYSFQPHGAAQLVLRLVSARIWHTG